MLVGLTLNTNLLFQIPIIYVLIMALAFSCSFLGHELAHKFMAQHYGLWAEFRLVKIGAILTLISILPFLFFKITFLCCIAIIKKPLYFLSYQFLKY